MIGGTVPVIERFWNTRVAAAVIGPGLSTDDISLLPTEISDQIPSGMGAVAVPGIPDQETCHFLEDPLSTGPARSPAACRRTCRPWVATRRRLLPSTIGRTAAASSTRRMAARRTGWCSTSW